MSVMLDPAKQEFEILAPDIECLAKICQSKIDIGRLNFKWRGSSD